MPRVGFVFICFIVIIKSILPLPSSSGALPRHQTEADALPRRSKCATFQIERYLGYRDPKEFKFNGNYSLHLAVQFRAVKAPFRNTTFVREITLTHRWIARKRSTVHHCGLFVIDEDVAILGSNQWNKSSTTIIVDDHGTVHRKKRSAYRLLYNQDIEDFPDCEWKAVLNDETCRIWRFERQLPYKRPTTDRKVIISCCCQNESCPEPRRQDRFAFNITLINDSFNFNVTDIKAALSKYEFFDFLT